ncbi:MAG: hypothetical protein JKY53_02745 [Flavobacteriales bacterium]|nr:hypothetical protein [Flavobacteriales bacterium]
MFESILDKVDLERDKFLAKDNSDRIWLLRRGVYFTIFLYFFLLLPKADFFFGQEALTHEPKHSSDWLEPFVKLLFTETFSSCYLYFIFGLFASIFIGVWKPFIRVASVFVYFFVFNLFNKAEYITNGSVTITCLLLFFLIFMSEKKKDYENCKSGYVDVLLTNTVFIIAQIQVCTVYLVAAIYKFTGEEWLAGTAFYYVLNFEFLSHKLVANQIFKSDFSLYFMNYFSLFYQVLFPFFVWIKSIKKWLLLAGLLINIGIIVINGLLDFGLIMIVSYSLFIDNETAKKVRGLVKSVFSGDFRSFKNFNSRN